MRKFDLSKLEGEVAVNCRTEEDANAFLNYIKEYNIIVYEEHLYEIWRDLKVECCFNIESNKTWFCNKKWYLDNGYKVLDLSEIEVFENTQQPTPKNNFKEYGFEGDFEGEIFKKVNNELYGIVYREFGNNWLLVWDSKSGKCYDNDGGYINYYLTPIKKPWYAQEENFEKYQGKLITNKFGEVRKIQYVDSNKVSTTQQNMYHDILNVQEWRLVNEEDITKLIYKEDK